MISSVLSLVWWPRGAIVKFKSKNSIKKLNKKMKYKRKQKQKRKLKQKQK